MEVEIEAEDVASEIEFWKSSLIMYVLGGDLSMTAVKQYMEKYWNFVRLPELYYNDEGYFILKFRTLDDMNLVMSKGPYTIYNMTMFLREWVTGFSLKDDMMRAVPIWVKLPQLPLHLWGSKSLGKIGSALGKPLFTDECTARKLRVSYARILVEVDITKKLKDSILIKDLQAKMINQPVEYEWKPLFCEKCQKLGHVCTPTTKRTVPRNIPKQWKVTNDRRLTTTGQGLAQQPASNGQETNSQPHPSGRAVTTSGNSTQVQPSTSPHQWQQVPGSSRSRNRSKEPVETNSGREVEQNIECRNGFEALRIVNDPSLPPEPGQ